MKRFFLFLIIAITSMCVAEAQKFTAKNERGQKIKYEVTSISLKTVQVIKNGYGKKIYTIPQTVSYKGVDYTVTAIGEKAFYECGIKGIELPNTIEVIGEKAFEDAKMTDIIYPINLREIKNSAFYNANLTSIILPEGIEKIGEEAFRKNNSATFISIPESVKIIGKKAFPDKKMVIQSLPSFIDATNCATFGLNQETVSAFLKSKKPTAQVTETAPVVEDVSTSQASKPVIAISETTKQSNPEETNVSYTHEKTLFTTSRDYDSDVFITDGEITGSDFYIDYNSKSEIFSVRIGYDLGDHLYGTFGSSVGFGDYSSSTFYTGYGFSERYLFKNLFVIQGHAYPYAGIASYGDEIDFAYGLNLDINGGVKIFQSKKGLRLFITLGYYTGAPEFKFDNFSNNGAWGIGLSFL